MNVRRMDRIKTCAERGDITEADGDRGREIEGYSLHDTHGGFDAPHSWKVPSSQVSTEYRFSDGAVF